MRGRRKYAKLGVVFGGGGADNEGMTLTTASTTRRIRPTDLGATAVLDRDSCIAGMLASMMMNRRMREGEDTGVRIRTHLMKFPTDASGCDTVSS